MSITERGQIIFGSIDERGKIIINNITENGQYVFGNTIINFPPSVTIVSVSLSKISDEPTKDRMNVVFKFDKDVTEWKVNVLGSSHDTGTLADSGLTVSSNAEITAEVDWTELYQEGDNRINIYGKDASGNWTLYNS